MSLQHFRFVGGLRTVRAQKKAKNPLQDQSWCLLPWALWTTEHSETSLHQSEFHLQSPPLLVDGPDPPAFPVQQYPCPFYPCGPQRWHCAITRRTKLWVYNASVISILHLGAQPWALNNTLVARLDGFNIRALRWIKRVNWFQYVTNATIPFIPTRSKAKNASVQSRHLPTTASSHMNHPPPSWLDTSHRAPLRPAWHDNSRTQIGVAKPLLDGGGWWTWLALCIQSKSAK